MSSLYERLCIQIQELRGGGVEPDKVVIPAERWVTVKGRAEVNEGEGYAGSDQTLVNGVKAVWTQRVSDAELIIEVDDD